MNKVFKIKKNNKGKTVVTSELAKNKGKLSLISTSLIMAINLFNPNIAHSNVKDIYIVENDALKISEFINHRGYGYSEKTYIIGANKNTYNVLKGDNTHIVRSQTCENIKREVPIITSNGTLVSYLEGNADNCNTDFTVHADKTTVTADGPLKISSESTTNENGTVTTNYHLTLDGDIGGGVDYEESVSAGSDNLTVKQEGTNETGGKNFVVDLAKSINLSESGSFTIGGVNITANNFNVGGNKITNVANGEENTDAVNVAQLKANKTTIKAGDKINLVEEKDENGGFVYTVNALTSEIKGSNNVKITEVKGDKGQSVYTATIDGDLTSINSISNGDTSIKLGDNQVNVDGARIVNLGVPVEANDATTKQYVDDGRTRVSSNDGSVKIVKTIIDQTTGAINYDLAVKQRNYQAGSQYLTINPDNDTIDLSQNTKTEIDKISKGFNTLTEDGVVKNRQLGDTLTIKGDKNIKTSTNNNGDVEIKLNDHVTVKSVKTGNVSISENGVNAGDKKITNVADGEVSADSKDAVNGSQLHNVLRQISVAQGNNSVNIINNKRIEQVEAKVDNLDKKVVKNRKEARGGIAGAAAIAGLPQVRGNGKSMVAASVGNFKGANAVAVGYSRANDNGKMILKLSTSVNNKGDFVSSAGVGYEW